MSNTAASLGVPDDHPAQILRYREESLQHPYLDTEVISGPRPEGIPGMRSWWATATVRDYTVDSLNVPVARMSLTLVNELLCDPVLALDAIDADSLILGGAVWSGGERRPEFEDLVPDAWGPVAFVNSYEVEPEWRGTPLSPMIALRMLAVLAELDVAAAVLYAAPYNSSISGADRTAASAKIAAMWERAGFTRLHPDAPPDNEFSRVMARALDPNEIDHDISALAGTDPVLREALEG